MAGFNPLLLQLLALRLSTFLDSRHPPSSNQSSLSPPPLASSRFSSVVLAFYCHCCCCCCCCDYPSFSSGWRYGTNGNSKDSPVLLYHLSFLIFYLLTLLFLNYLPVRMNVSLFLLKNGLRNSQNCRNYEKSFDSGIREYAGARTKNRE